MTVADLQKIWSTRIAPEDFLVLAGEALEKEKAFLLAHPEHSLSAREEEQCFSFLKRREKHEPVAYITGHKEFYGREFKVTKDTLIPRPETELMIEAILSYIESSPEIEKDIIDVGTGSGNIIITLAEELKNLSFRYFGFDISLPALAVAKENGKSYTYAHAVQFIESDLLEKYFLLREKKKGIIIAANLPYLSQEIFESSEKDVKDYEPTSALLSEEHGMYHYKRLLEEIERLEHSFDHMALFLEISPEQGGILGEYIQKKFPSSSVKIIPDLTGRKRLIQVIF